MQNHVPNILKSADPATESAPPGSQAADPLVGIVIVNYQSFDDTVRCVAALNLLEYPRLQICIVDNNSPDDSGYHLRRHFAESEVEVIINASNEGFAAANNLGMRYLQTGGCQLFWLLNSTLR